MDKVVCNTEKEVLAAIKVRYKFELAATFKSLDLRGVLVSQLTVYNP